MKANRVEKIVWSVFFFLGVVFLSVGTFVCIKIFDYSDKVNVTGTITSIRTYGSGDSKTHKVYVSYEVDGVKYESRLNGYSSNYYEGKKINIYYDKNDPSSIGSKSLNYLFLMFPGMGLIFACLGGGGLLFIYKKKKMEKTLRATGNKIYTTYHETVINRSYSVNNQHPFMVICKWEDPADNRIYYFKSKNIWFDPAPNFTHREDIFIPVYIDKNNKEKYIVDLESFFGNID